ncbi:MAG: hypothetical protein HXS43_07290 [Theionarchaea archaeon]|nr:hypothetical protein [Theionarchaea archaeon]
MTIAGIVGMLQSVRMTMKGGETMFRELKEKWDESPWWIRLLILFGILYYLSRRKGIAFDFMKLVIFLLVFPFFFVFFLLFWLVNTYYEYVPLAMIIGMAIFFVRFFLMIHYRRKQRRLLGINDEPEEIYTLPLRGNMVRRTQFLTMPSCKIEFVCGNCGLQQVVEMDTWFLEFNFRCKECGAINELRFKKKQR